jgi:hypothetical protein
MSEQMTVPGTTEAVAEVVDESAPKKKGRAKKSASTGAAVAQITPELTAELEHKRAFWAETLLEIQNAPLNTQAEVDMLDACAKEAKRQLALLEEQKDSIVKPLNAALTATRRLFGPAIEFCKSCESAVKGRIVARLNEQNQRQSAALAAVAQGQRDAATLAVATGQELVAVPEGTYEIEEWHAEVVEPTALPPAYWIPNQAMLDAIAKDQKQQAHVPGVRFFKTSRLAMRAG